MGWIFFYSGWVKVITFFTPAADWSASSFLAGQEGPLAPLFASLAGNVFIDYLNAFGQLAIGLGLMSGILVRQASLWGIVLMSLYYLVGFPPSNAFLVDSHIIYIVVLALLR